MSAPNYPLRLDPERRAQWQLAADIEKRKLGSFIKCATDERAERTIAMSKYTFIIDCDPGENEQHDFEAEKEAMDYLKRRYPNLTQEGYYGERSRGIGVTVADFAPEGSTGRYDVYILGPRDTSGDRPVIWPPQRGASLQGVVVGLKRKFGGA